MVGHRIRTCNRRTSPRVRVGRVQQLELQQPCVVLATRFGLVGRQTCPTGGLLAHGRSAVRHGPQGVTLTENPRVGGSSPSLATTQLRRVGPSGSALCACELRTCTATMESTLSGPGVRRVAARAAEAVDSTGAREAYGTTRWSSREESRASRRERIPVSARE